MKKIKYFALMMAIAFTSAIGFTACSSSDETAADVNPTYDGTNVRTDFAFNITKASQGTTRMSGKNVQEGDGNGFLGMKDMFLLPFSEVPAAGKTTNYTFGSVRNYALGSLTTTDIYGTGDLAEKSSKVYSLTIPVGTNNLLFYGIADGDATQGGLGRDFEKGKVKSSLANTVSSTDDILFDLESIKKDGLGTDATNIAQYLTAIANAKYTDKTTSPATEKKWASTVTTAGSDGNYSAIALLYTKFTTNITQYAGSKEAVERLVFDLYKTAYAINGQSNVTEVREIAKAICKAIENTGGTVRLVLKNGETEFSIDDETPPDEKTADNWKPELKGVNPTFPANLSLPMGAAQLTWNVTDKEFKYKLDGFNNPSTNIGTETTALITDYRYPSEIIYFDNSPLRATYQYKQVDDYPKTTNAWDVMYQAETWPQTTVAATTRAVAMTNNVNYGVALLETTVKLASTSLTDNMKGIIKGSAKDQTINVVTEDEYKSIADKKSIFKVTGVLVGGQPKQVGWNMISSTTDYNSVIYDKDVTFKTTALSTSPTAENYTVVFDNYATTGDQKDVLIALEIVNDGCDFYGAEGLIPAGNTFYLIGKLDLTNNTQDWSSGDNKLQAVRPTTYRITNESTKRVFVQDYKTKATLTLKDDALKRAYSAIPDLRATEVLFGLSVDLKWEPGMTFDVQM